MNRRASSVVLTLTLVALVALPTGADTGSNPADEVRITADEAATLTVNQVTQLGGGYHPSHPRR